jgi:hypothetical protein
MMFLISDLGYHFSNFIGDEIDKLCKRFLCNIFMLRSQIADIPDHRLKTSFFPCGGNPVKLASTFCLQNRVVMSEFNSFLKLVYEYIFYYNICFIIYILL